jgi:hypothetical protein
MATRSKDDFQMINGKLDQILQKLEFTDDIKVTGEKLDKIFEKIDLLHHFLHQVNNEFLNNIQKDLTEQILDLKNTMQSNLREVTMTMKQTTKHGIPDNIWAKRLNQRKFSFYEAYRNESIANIYEDALKDAIPRIPKKFFKNPTSQQSTMERNLQKELMCKEVQHEIKRLRIMSDVKKDFVSRIDNEMANDIHENYSSGEAQQHLTKWKDIVEKEVNLSKHLWDKKSNFFSSDMHLLPIDGPAKIIRRNFPLNNRSYRPPIFNRPNYRPRFNNNIYFDPYNNTYSNNPGRTGEFYQNRRNQNPWTNNRNFRRGQIRDNSWNRNNTTVDVNYYTPIDISKNDHDYGISDDRPIHNEDFTSYGINNSFLEM